MLSSPPSTQGAGEQKAIGLGINTEPKPNEPPTTTLQDSSLDSLFDISDNNGTNVEMDFDNIDFNFDDQTQTQSNDFDISTFGDVSQDPNVSTTGLGVDVTSADVSSNVKNNSAKPLDESSFNLANIGGGENMDLDLSMFGAADSTFDDMFIDGGDAGGDEMEHGNFDSDFFGIGN
jgi:hypothetical protein